MMYVVGGVDENEIMLYNVILALRDSLHLLFKYVSVSTTLSARPRFAETATSRGVECMA